MIPNVFSSPRLRTQFFDLPAAEPRVAPTFIDNKESRVSETGPRAFGVFCAFAGLAALDYFRNDFTGTDNFLNQELKKFSFILTMGVGLVATSSGYKDIKNNQKVSGVAKLALGLLSFGALGYSTYTNMPPPFIECHQNAPDLNNHPSCGRILSVVQDALKKGEFDPIPALKTNTYYEDDVLCMTKNSTTLRCLVGLKKEAADLLDPSLLQTSSTIDSFKNASQYLLDLIPGCEKIKNLEIVARIPKLIKQE